MKCLIVDEDARLCRDYAALAARRGYVCYSVATLRDARYLLRTHAFDLVLLDLSVGHEITLGIVDCLDVMDSRALIILVTASTAFSRGEVRQICPRIDYELRKPVNLSDLAALIDHERAPRSAAG